MDFNKIVHQLTFNLNFVCINLEPPSFAKTPDPLEVLPGMSVTFRSLIRGTPPFKVNWFKGSRELVPGKTCNIILADSTAELELFEVGPLQTGDYTCLATNDAGNASCTTHLFVKGRSKCIPHTYYGM